MTPNLPSVVRRAGLEPAPLSGGDFKSDQTPSSHNNLAPAHCAGEASGGSERNTQEVPLATNLATSDGAVIS